MIDEKKIEEAKEAFIADKKILGIVAINDLACGFKAGAKWMQEEFLKDLWHPASEEPNEKAYLLCYRKNKVLPFKVDKHSAIYNWKVFVYNFNITRWLYIDDLLPKEGGKE